MESACLYALKSACSCLVSQAMSSAANELDLQRGVQDDAEFLTKELDEMKKFLVYVDRNEAAGELVEVEPMSARADVEEARREVEKFRDMALDITDCLQDLGPHRETPSTWRLPWETPAWQQRHSIAAELKELKSQVEEMTTRSERYQRARDRAAVTKLTTTATLVRPVEEEAWPVAPEIDWRVDLGHLVARPEVKSLTVISVWLMKDPGRGRAISLVGEVYNDATEKFMCRAWVTVTSPLISLSEFLRAMVRQLLVNDPAPEWAARGALSVLGETEAMAAEQLMALVAQRLSGRRYLVVVEDISTRPAWDWIKLIFPDDNNGSRILVTSHRPDVARHCAEWPSRSLNLERVSDDDARLYVSSDKGATTSREFLEVIKLEPYSEFFGRNEDVDQLIRMILLSLNNTTTQSIALSVYGASGIGKSTLVRNVYDSTKTLHQRRAWITIVRPFNKEDFLRETISQFQAGCSLGSGTKSKSCDDMVTEICQLMQDGRSLLVLDGLEAEEEWNQVKTCLWTESGTDSSCTVMVTTTSAAVASHCSGHESLMYNLKPINRAAAYQLFYQKVFMRARIVELSKPMVDHANRIIQKCDGNLLGMNIISGHLGTKPRTSAEWEKMLNRFESELKKNHNVDVASAAAKLSYDDLPFHMKYLVQYLSSFPRSNRIMKRRLAKAWLAESCRRNATGDNVVEVEDILDALVKRSIVHPSKRVEITSGRINGCHVVDVFRQLCFSEAKSQVCINILDEDTVNNMEISQMRHLVVTSGWSRGHDDQFKKLNLSWARSLTVFGKWTSCFISPSMKMLRVLDLEDTQDLVEHHDLEHIWEFRHLKYLGLRNTGIVVLPKSLGKLLGLEELDIRGTYIAKLPSTVVHLTRLTCVHGGSGTSMAACSSRAEIVSEMSRDCSGLHEDAAASSGFSMFLRSRFQRHKPHGVRVPQKFGELKSLLTLGTIDAAGGRSVLEEIQKLTQIQKLGVTGITKRNSKQLCSTLEHLPHLRFLMVHSDDSSLSRLDTVPIPPHNLQTLKLYGNLGRLPRWMKALHSLLKLCLSTTLLNGDSIQIIAKLPKLIVLRLLAKSLVVQEIAFQCDAFPRLELLQLDQLENLMSLSFQRGAVPNLEILEVYNCNLLSEASLHQFYELPRIKKVWFHGMIVQKEPLLHQQDFRGDPSDDPFDIPEKGLPKERMRKWRQAALVLNASRRYRYTLDMKNEEQKEEIRRKIRSQESVIRAAFRLNKLDREEPHLRPSSASVFVAAAAPATASHAHAPPFE